MKRRIFLPLTLALALLLAALSGCAPSENVPAATSRAEPVTLVLATDLHYISPAICDNGEAFRTAVEHGDGKAMYYIQEIIEGFVDEMLTLRPDAVLLTGDLTFSGAKVSHEDLVKLLTRLTEAEIPTLVIPGNHDLDSDSALSFSGADYAAVESISGEEFAALYAPFGLEQALSRDEHSLSYVYAPRKDLRILMLDANSAGWCSIPDETMDWVEGQLKSARRAGAKVIAASHQNINVHMNVFSWGYQIVQGDALRALYEDYGVLCNLSGHLHLQHIVDGAVPEAATSALSLNPNQYAVITYDGETLSYHTEQLDLSAWAKKQGSDDPNLLDFAAYSERFMIDTARAKQSEKLAGSGMSEADIAAYCDAFARLNAVYFAGDTVNAEDFRDGLSRIDGGTTYLDTITADPRADHHSFTRTAD